jgi:CheY-like chemotaxis protein
MTESSPDNPNTQRYRPANSEHVTNRVLIIDDDVVIQRLIAMVLGANGYACEAASGVKQALEQITQKRPDLIFLDLMMPEISGIDFLKYRRTSPELKAIPVIISSAVGDESVLQEVRALGVAGYLVKPFGQHQLLSLVRRTLPIHSKNNESG